MCGYMNHRNTERGLKTELRCDLGVVHRWFLKPCKMKGTTNDYSKENPRKETQRKNGPMKKDRLHLCIVNQVSYSLCMSLDLETRLKCLNVCVCCINGR